MKEKQEDHNWFCIKYYILFLPAQDYQSRKIAKSKSHMFKISLYKIRCFHFFAQKLQTQNLYVKTKLLCTNIIVRKRYRLNFKYKSHILYQKKKFVTQSIKYFKIQIQKLYLLHLA